MRKICAALAAVLVLSACSSGGDDEPEGAGDPGEGGSSSAEATEEPEAPEDERDLWRGSVVETMPDGDPELITTIAEKKTFGSTSDFLFDGGVVFGDEVAVMSPETQLLTAVDLESGKRLWQTRLPKYQGETLPLCPLAQLPAGATAGVVMMGIKCGVFVRYDLATGEILGTQVYENLLEIAGINAAFDVGRATFWVDVDNALWQVGADGTSDLVLRNDELGLSPSESVLDAMAIWGSDVVAIKLGDIDRIGGSYHRRWIGLKVPAEGAPEVTWSMRERRALAEAQPGGKPKPGGNLAYAPEYGGIVETLVMKGIETPRLNRINAETGDLDTGLVLERDPAGGFPAWADSLGADQVLPVEDGMFSSSGKGGFAGFANLTMYDFTTGDIRWTFTQQFESYGAQGADPVAVSADGAHVYGMVWAAEPRLVELDAETGKLQRTWYFPREVGIDLSDAQVHIRDDLMIWLASYDSSTTKTYAATFRLG